MERTLLGASKRGREPMNEKNGGMAQRGMVAERGILGINGEITIRQPQVGTGKTMLINYLLEVRTGRIFRDRTAA